MSEAPRPPVPSSVDALDEINLADVGAAIRRGRWLIVACVVVALAVGWLVVLVQPPVYEANALVRIVPEEKGFDFGSGSSNSSMRLMLGLDQSGDLQTSIGIFESRRIAEAIVDSLALHVVMKRPQGARDGVLQVLEAPRPMRKSRLELRRTGADTYAITGSSRQGTDPDHVRLGETTRIGELVIRLHPDLQHAAPERITLELRPYQRTVRRLQNRLAVTQPSSGSELIKLRYRHTDSLLVAAVPNLAAAGFIEYKNSTSSSESRSILGFLQEQAEQYRQDLRDTEIRLQAFLEQSRIVEPQTEAEEQARRLAVLQAEREGVASERATLAALLDQIEASPRAPNEPSPYRQLIAFPSFLANSMVQYILQSIIALENERAGLLVRRLERDPDVVGQTTRIHELEQQLHQIALNYLNDRDRRIAALDGTLDRLGHRNIQLPAQQVELRRLTRETELLEEVYQMIETKLKEEEIRAAAQLANIQIVDRAVVPDEPELPKPWAYLVLSGLLGLFFGSGMVVWRARGRPTVNSGEDVFASTAGLPVLAAIDLPLRRPHRANGGRPLFERLDPRPRLLGKGQSATPSEVRPEFAFGSAALSLNGSKDRLEDSYRSLRTNLAAVDVGTGTADVLVVAGVELGDDGAFTAANLAIAYADLGRRVALVDVDLRGGGRLDALFNVPPKPGLADALLEPDALDRILHGVEVGRAGRLLSLLPAGNPNQHPADALGSDSMRELIQRLRRDHDHVIIAAPAVNSAPDTPLVAQFADRVVLVITTHETSRPALQTATNQLLRLRVPLEGVVVHSLAS